MELVSVHVRYMYNYMHVHVHVCTATFVGLYLLVHVHTCPAIRTFFSMSTLHNNINYRTYVVYMFSVKVWDSNWNLVCTFVGHSGCVTSLTPHPYGPMIVSGSTDTSLRVWNLTLRDQVEM